VAVFPCAPVCSAVVHLLLWLAVAGVQCPSHALPFVRQWIVKVVATQLEEEPAGVDELLVQEGFTLPAPMSDTRTRDTEVTVSTDVRLPSSLLPPSSFLPPSLFGRVVAPSKRRYVWQCLCARLVPCGAATVYSNVLEFLRSWTCRVHIHACPWAFARALYLITGEARLRSGENRQCRRRCLLSR